MNCNKGDDLFEEFFAQAVIKNFEDELAALDAMMERGEIPEYTFSDRHNERMRKLFEMDRKLSGVKTKWVRKCVLITWHWLSAKTAQNISLSKRCKL